MQDIEQNQAIARLSTAYIVGVLCEILHTDTLDILDVLITMAVSSANGAHLSRTTSSPRFAGVAEPDAAGFQRGISRNAVSRALNVPLETVRRRVGNLLTRDILEERPDGLVLAASANVGPSGNPRLAGLNAQMLRQLFRGLKAQGVKLD